MEFGTVGPHVLTWIVCKNILVNVSVKRWQQQRKTVLDKLFIYPF